MANLLQVSSAYGRAMESVDRLRMSITLYPTLRRFASKMKTSNQRSRERRGVVRGGIFVPDEPRP